MKRKIFLSLLTTLIFLFTLGLWWPAQPVVDNWPDVSNSPDIYFQNVEANFQFADSQMQKHIQRPPEGLISDSVVIYLHGWSASPMETYPVPHQIPKILEMPVVFQRLTGHGVGTDGFRGVTAQKLWDDTLEAVQVAKQLGKKIFIMGCSTGATLAIDFALRFPDQVHGLILVSPNFRLNATGAFLLSGPLGKILARLFVGEYREWKPRTEQIQKYWTKKYASENIPAMMETMKRIDAKDLKEIKIPVLTLMTKKDDVIDTTYAEKRLATLGSADKEIAWLDSDHHVPFGNWYSPQTNAAAEEKIHAFLKRYGTASSY